MPAAKKQKGGFWRGVFLFLLGATTGMGGAAVLVAYTENLHLPLIEPPTRSPELSGEQARKRNEEEVLQFRDVLRSQQPKALEQKDIPEPTPALQTAYYLQIGAFRENRAAEKIRGELLLLGRKAIIKPSQTADGKSLYRVWVGPYEDANKAESARAQLALEGYDNISLLRTSGG